MIFCHTIISHKDYSNVSGETQHHTTLKFYKFDIKKSQLCGLWKFIELISVKLPSFFDGVGVRDTRMILSLWYTIAYFRYGGNGVLENLILLMKNAKGGILKN